MLTINVSFINQLRMNDRSWRRKNQISLLLETISTEMETPTDGGSHNSALERCLEVLRAARNDSEQFAALLLVTKCARAQELDDTTRHRIFDAVGFSFPNRLFFTKTTPDGCPEYLFRSLGLTFLACFCTDPSLASHPQVINKIPILNETLNISCQEDNTDLTSMVEDAYQCLTGILASTEGPKQLVSGGTLSSLCEAYVKQNHGWTHALRILTALLTSLPEMCWKKSRSELQCLLVKLSEDFDNESDSQKFHLAEILPVFLPPSPLLLETSWGGNCLNHLSKGLLKILSSKLSISQRDPAFKLAACLSNVYGSSWIMINIREEKAKFLSLLVNLACVEVRMALEDPMPLDSRQAAATACYALVEMGIQECTKEEGHPLLRELQKLQLLQVMQEACAAVMYYLQQVGWERIEDPFVLASVRLLGVWLAEETSCLRQEVIQLLPFLIHYMRTWFQRGVTCRNQLKDASQMALVSSNWGALWPGDAIRFLLPALCHLSAEEAPRKILISEEVPALLCEYYQLNWEIFSNKDLTVERKYEAQLSIQSCCGVFLNLVVTEPSFVCQESCFVTLLKLLMQSLPEQLVKEGKLILVANVSTLGLMMSRLLASSPVMQESFSQDFFLAVIQFLSHSHVLSRRPDEEKEHIALSDGYAQAWADISELWFLGVQAFSACLPLLPWLCSLVLTSGWLQGILCLLDKVSPESVNLELVTVLQSLLTQLAQSSAPCRELIQHHGGIEKANIFGMAALEQCLSEMV